MPSHYIASSKRSSPQAISHSVPSVPKLFPTVSRPSTLSSLPCRSFPSELSPSYFPQLSFRPPFHRFRVAPSPRTSPRYFPRFPFHPPSRCFRIGSPALCSPAISTLPTQLSPSYFHVLDPQFFGTIAFMEFVLKTRCQKLCILVSLPTQLSPSYFHPPYAALPQLFPRLGPTVFQSNRIDGNCPENPSAKSSAF